MGDLFRALFSRSGEEIYLLTNNNIYLYDLKTSKTLQLTRDIIVAFFGIEDNGDVIYSIEKWDEKSSKYNYSIVRTDAIGNNPKEIILSETDFPYFDLSYYGEKILFTKISPDGYIREFMIYDPQIPELYTIPIENISCGSPSKIDSTSNFVIFHTASCSKGPIGGTLTITDLNGNSEILVPYTNDNPSYFSISPDDFRMFFGSGNNTISVITFVKPIPEFDSLAIIILTISLVSIIAYQKKFSFRLWTN